MGILSNILGSRQVPSQLKRGGTNVEAEISRLLTVVDNLTTDVIPTTVDNQFVSPQEKAAWNASASPIKASGQVMLGEGSASVGIVGILATDLGFETLVSINGGDISTTAMVSVVCTENAVTITAIRSDGTTNINDSSTINYFITAPTVI